MTDQDRRIEQARNELVIRLQLADAEKRFYDAMGRDPESPVELLDWVEANGGLKRREEVLPRSDEGDAS